MGMQIASNRISPCVHAHAYTHAFMHTQQKAYTHTHTRTRIHAHAETYTQEHTRTNTHAQAYMRTHPAEVIHTVAYTHKHTRTSIHAHAFCGSHTHKSMYTCMRKQCVSTHDPCTHRASQLPNDGVTELPQRQRLQRSQQPAAVVHVRRTPTVPRKVVEEVKRRLRVCVLPWERKQGTRQN